MLGRPKPLRNTDVFDMIEAQLYLRNSTGAERKALRTQMGISMPQAAAVIGEICGTRPDHSMLVYWERDGNLPRFKDYIWGYYAFLDWCRDNLAEMTEVEAAPTRGAAEAAIETSDHEATVHPIIRAERGQG